MKMCRRCNLNKDIVDYYKHPGMSDGYLNICKECTKRRVKNYHENNFEKISAYEHIRNQKTERRERLIKNARRWRTNNPTAYKAQTALNNALRDGKIIRKPCRFCGSKKNLHAHHTDYINSLNVVWLCAKCHHRMHHDIPKTEGDNKAVSDIIS